MRTRDDTRQSRGAGLGSAPLVNFEADFAILSSTGAAASCQVTLTYPLQDQSVIAFGLHKRRAPLRPFQKVYLGEARLPVRYPCSRIRVVLEAGRALETVFG